MSRSSRLKRKLAKEIADIQDIAITKTGADRGFSNLASNTIRDAPPSLKKMAEVGGLTPATTRMAPSIWNPMLQITSMVLPRSIEEKNQWRRWYYQHDPIVGTAIDLHTRFPISQFRLRCDNDANGAIAEEYKEMADDLNLFKLFLSMGKEFWVCLTPDTDITMSNGTLRNITNVAVGDCILTHDGTVHTVTELMSREVSEDIYEIKVQGSNKPIKLTGNHPILVYAKDSTLDSPVWCNAKDIHKDDFVVMPTLQSDVNEGVTPEYARLLGYYVSEGCIKKNPRKRDKNGCKAGNYHGLRLYAQEQTQVADMYSSLAACTKNKAHVRLHSTSNKGVPCYEVGVVSDMCLTDRLLKDGGHLSYSKVLSDEVMNWPLENILEFFIGYINGDGWVDKTAYTVGMGTTSEQLANQLKILLQRLGVCAASRHRSTPNRPIYYVTLNMGDSYNLFNGLIKDSEYLRQPKKKTHGNFMREGHTLALVTEVTTIEYSGLVYNFEVDTNHSYVANNIAVHNCGEVFPFGIWNETDNKWDSFILMNPDYLDVQMNPYAQRDPVISITKWSQQMKQIISNGPNHGKTGYIYRHLAETASDILKAIQLNLPYHLSPMAISHIANKVSYFDVRGTSIIDRIFKILMYQDKLQVAQMAGAERYTTPVEMWTAGNDESPADDDVLDQLEQMIRDSWTSPQKAIVWNHTLHGEMLGGAGSLLALPPEFEYIDKQKYAALMMNESVLTNNGPTYASASVAMDYMVSWYSTYRQEMEQWALHNVFEPVARAREYYTITKKELVGGYRDKTAQRKPIVPKIVWDKANLRDDYQKLQTMIQLAESNKSPWRLVYEMLNMDFDSTMEELKKEAKDFQKLNAIYTEAAGAAAPGGEGAMGAMGGGGGGELGGMPIEDGGGVPDMNGVVPEAGENSAGGAAMAPESVGAPPGAGPSGMA